VRLQLQRLLLLDRQGMVAWDLTEGNVGTDCCVCLVFVGGMHIAIICGASGLSTQKYITRYIRKERERT
jgi:hypothetical protein